MLIPACFVMLAPPRPYLVLPPEPLCAIICPFAFHPDPPAWPVTAICELVPPADPPAPPAVLPWPVLGVTTVPPVPPFAVSNVPPNILFPPLPPAVCAMPMLPVPITTAWLAPTVAALSRPHA